MWIIYSKKTHKIVLVSTLKSYKHTFFIKKHTSVMGINYSKKTHKILIVSTLKSHKHKHFINT